MDNIYSLKRNPPGRRAGLTRAGYDGPRLLQTINTPNKTSQDAMRPRVATASLGKVKQEEVVKETEEAIYASPKGDDDSDSSDDGHTADMYRTDFTRTSEEPKQQTLGSKPRLNRTVKGRNVSVNGNGTKSSLRSGSSKLPGTKSSPNLSIVSGSPKRKSQENLSSLGAGMVDAFGRVNVKKAKKSGTNSSQRLYGLSQSTKTISKQTISKLYKNKLSQDESPRKKFIKPQTIEGPDTDDDSPVKPKFKKPQINDYPVKSDAEEPTRLRRLLRPDSGSPGVSPGSATKKFIRSKVFESPKRSDDEQLPTFKKRLDPFDDDLFSETPIRLDKLKNPKQTEPPATQLGVFRKIVLPEGLDDDLVDATRTILSQDGPRAHVVPTFEDDFPTMTQRARCPMCNQPVDLNDLRTFGEMNTRRQEKFCRSHQKKTAMETWELNDYPDIKWKNLDLRIAKHHSFIKELINGKDSHYRQTLEETVKAGKDRTLLKMTSNLTPGYYGSRGLREISESIMKEFTPLLKKRNVADRLMAARGVTGFVQSVLVPEVTVLLIMEDMSASVGRAREILTESVGIGELVHEEIRDVVQRVDDSEDDDGFDD